MTDDNNAYMSRRSSDDARMLLEIIVVGRMIHELMGEALRAEVEAIINYKTSSMSDGDIDTSFVMDCSVVLARPTRCSQ